MARSSETRAFWRLIRWSAAAAVVAIVASLFYLAAQPGGLQTGTVLTVVLGVGLTVMIAGGLAALMFRSSRSGRDELVGRDRHR